MRILGKLTSKVCKYKEGKNSRKKEQLVLACMYTCISAAHRRCPAVLCRLCGPSSLVPCCGVISVGPEELMKSGACVCMITVGRSTKGRAHEDNRCQFTASQPILLLCIKRPASLIYVTCLNAYGVVKLNLYWALFKQKNIHSCMSLHDLGLINNINILNLRSYLIHWTITTSNNLQHPVSYITNFFNAFLFLSHFQKAN